MFLKEMQCSRFGLEHSALLDAGKGSGSFHVSQVAEGSARGPGLPRASPSSAFSGGSSCTAVGPGSAACMSQEQRTPTRFIFYASSNDHLQGQFSDAALLGQARLCFILQGLK